MKMHFWIRAGVFCALAASAGETVAGSPDDPAADPRAIVVCGAARFTVLTDRLIRMEQSPDGAFEDRASLVFVNRRLPVPEFKVTRSDGGCAIDTGRLLLTYAGGAFTPGSLKVEGRGTRPFVWRFGDRDRGNLLGTTRTLDTVGDRSSLLRRMEKGILSRDGWAVVDDSKGFVFEPTADHWRNWAAPRGERGRTDLYFFGYGHDYKAALGDYVKVAGRIPLPPRFAFGYWWSRYWPYSDDEIDDIVDTLDGFGIPLDVMIVDMDWHDTYGIGRNSSFDDVGQRVGWTGYTWKDGLFTNPKSFLKRLHDRHLKVALNIHPASGIQPMEECYARFREAYGWEGTNAIPYRLSEPKWADCWYDRVLGELEEGGVDFWWLDWQQWLTSKYMPGLSNTFWLNHTMAHHEGEKRDADGRALRPLIYHRWGGLGSHRYQMGFSGDTLVRWSMLAEIPWFTATSGNVGYGYWGHDVGGHMDPQGAGHEPEIFTRWLQGAVFTPLFKTHSSCSPEMERRIWKYPDHFETMRETFRLRYRLAPYVYTAARAAYDTGVSLCRPLYWDNPEDDAAYSPYFSELRFGSDIVSLTVASHTDPATALATARLWLPPKASAADRWYDAATGEMLPSGETLYRTYSIDENPWFVRAGAILPMNPPSVRNLQSYRGEEIELFVAPGAGSGEGELYEDDGLSADYETAFARTRFAMEAEGTTLTVGVSACEGRYDGMPSARRWTIRLPNRLAPTRVTLDDGRELPWRYDGRLPGVVVTTPALDPAKPFEVAFAFATPVADGEALLAGVRGFCSRARKLSQELKEAVELAAPMAMPPDEWLALASVSSRLAEYPADIERTLLRLAEDRRTFRAKFAPTAAIIPPALDAKIDAWLFPKPIVLDVASALVPCDLRVDHSADRPVRTRPTFSWRFTTATNRDDAVQTAYRIRVREGGKTLWDSGVVYGDAKGGCRYDGQALEPDREYAWELELADERGNFSAPVRGVFHTAADAPECVACGDADAGFERIKSVHRFWRETGDVTAVADNWDRMAAAPVFMAPETKTFAEDVRLIRAAWLMKEMALDHLGPAESAKYAARETDARVRFAARAQEADGSIRPGFHTVDNLLMAFKARVMKSNEVKTRMGTVLRQMIEKDGLPKLEGRFEAEDTLKIMTEDAWLSWLVWKLAAEKRYDPSYAPLFKEWRVMFAAGIREHWDSTGYRRFRLAPIVSDRVDGVAESYDSASGLITSRWRWGEDGTWVWDAEVPPGSSAEVNPPSARPCVWGPGRHHLELKLPRR